MCALHTISPQLVLQAIDVMVRSNRDNVLRYGFKKVRGSCVLATRHRLSAGCSSKETAIRLHTS